MAITSGTILRIVASMLWDDGEVAQNVFNAVVTGGGSPWDEADIVDDAIAWVTAMYAPLTTHVSDNLDGNYVAVYEYDSVDDDWDEVGSGSWTWNPTVASENLPRAASGLVRLWTTDPDVQGKKYIPGITEDGVLDGVIQSGGLTGLLGFAAVWWLAFTGGTSGASWAPGIWSVVGKVFLTAIEHYAASAIMAYQRRRKRNVGI